MYLGKLSSESEVNTYKRALELMGQELAAFETITMVDVETEAAFLRAQALKFRILIDNSLKRWEPREESKDPNA